MKQFDFTRRNPKSKAIEKVGSLKMQTLDDGSCELYFYGDICSSEWDRWTEEDKCPQNIADFLRDIDPMAALHIYINSGGGDVFGGVAIYNQLRRHEGPITVTVDGLAASIASVIALAGDELIMLSGAQLMIHKPWSLCVGDAAEMQRTAALLDKIEETILDIYEEHTRDGVTRERIRELVDAETWMTGAEAAEIFNVTVQQGQAAAACDSEFFDQYKKYRSKESESRKAYELGRCMAEGLRIGAGKWSTGSVMENALRKAFTPEELQSAVEGCSIDTVMENVLRKALPPEEGDPPLEEDEENKNQMRKKKLQLEQESLRTRLFLCNL